MAGKKNRTVVSPAPAQAVQCEGHRRRGNAFSFGPVTWEQCKNDATVLITVEQNGEVVKDSPACTVCWEESRKLGIKQLDVKPIKPKGKE